MDIEKMINIVGSIASIGGGLISVISLFLVKNVDQRLADIQNAEIEKEYFLKKADKVLVELNDVMEAIRHGDKAANSNQSNSRIINAINLIEAHKTEIIKRKHFKLLERIKLHWQINTIEKYLYMQEVDFKKMERSVGMIIALLEKEIIRYGQE